MHNPRILMHTMRTTINIDDELLEKASRLTGISEKTALVHEGLHMLVQRAAAKRLAALGGSDPDAKAPRRRRSSRSRSDAR
jgi:Arc/MetJ family transcription regulator